MDMDKIFKYFKLWFAIVAVTSLATTAALVYALYAGAKWLIAHS